MADRIADICRREFPSLREDMPVRAAVALMLDARAGAAPVLDNGGTLLGVLSQRDCFRSALNAAYYQHWQGVVGEHMSRDPVTLEADTDFVTAAEAFLSEPYREYPVVDGRAAYRHVVAVGSAGGLP